VKRLSILIIVLAAASLACKTVERAFLPPGTETSPSAPTSVAGLEESTPFQYNGDVNACLERLGRILQGRSFDPLGNEIYESNEAEFNLVLYDVVGDEIKNPVKLYVPPDYRKYQDDTAGIQRIWDFYITIIPAEFRTPIDEMVIFTDNPNGPYGAWVAQQSGDPQHWRVGFDLLDSSNPLYLTDVVVHETAHLITLNVSQVPQDAENYYYFNGSRNVPDCAQVVVSDGCSQPDSYINQFYQRFWREIYMEWWTTQEKAREKQSDTEYLDVMETFYRAHPDLFLEPYAATNIKEDMAVSFENFVLKPEPGGNTIVDQKIRFYYEFPELVALREHLIENLCTYVK
jgi:hypothetical protein